MHLHPAHHFSGLLIAQLSYISSDKPPLLSCPKSVSRLEPLPVPNMGLKALPMSPSQNGFLCKTSFAPSLSKCHCSRNYNLVVLSAKKEKTIDESEKKQSLFSSVTEALDFSQVRSVRDAELLEDAREATQSGGRMSREQYGALRRKIGGTYTDFFKSYVEVDGQYVEEGWVDKTCKVCRKDTAGEPREVDKFGRYVHVACLENSKPGNFFTKLFST